MINQDTIAICGGQLIIMARMEQMECHQTHGNHVFDTILLQPLPRACPPQLRCHQPPGIAMADSCLMSTAYECIKYNFIYK
jgi:hypothetical protein